jgi:hypothetical protein
LPAHGVEREVGVAELVVEEWPDHCFR